IPLILRLPARDARAKLEVTKELVITIILQNQLQLSRSQIEKVQVTTLWVTLVEANQYFFGMAGAQFFDTSGNSVERYQIARLSIGKIEDEQMNALTHGLQIDQLARCIGPLQVEKRRASLLKQQPRLGWICNGGEPYS